MADIDPKELAKFITATHSTDRYAQVFGTATQALNTLTAMGLVGGRGAVPQPGWIDDAVGALQSDEPVLKTTDQLTGERVQAEWYKVGRQGTVTNIIFDYLTLPLLALNSAKAEYDIAGARAGDKIGKIKERNPTDEISAMRSLTEEYQTQFAFYQTYAALQELIHPTPKGPTGKVIVKKGRRGSKAYIVYGNVPPISYT